MMGGCGTLDLSVLVYVSGFWVLHRWWNLGSGDNENIGSSPFSMSIYFLEVALMRQRVASMVGHLVWLDKCLFMSAASCRGNGVAACFFLQFHLQTMKLIQIRLRRETCEVCVPLLCLAGLRLSPSLLGDAFSGRWYITFVLHWVICTSKL